MITVGPMALNQPQAADPMEPFFLGTQSGGGYWTDMSRISSHDHSGGLMGAPVAVNIPDGSITAADLDPSVLAPYALVDGSKPFTGQVTMQADAVVRDALYFGQQGSALAPDVTLTRTGVGALRVDTHLGVGVNPVAWLANYRAVQVGQGGALFSGADNANTILGQNVHYATDGQAKALFAAEAALVELNFGTVAIKTAPSVAAGAAQTFTTRASIAPIGTLTLTPDAGQSAIASAAGQQLQITSNGLNYVFGGAGQTFYPGADASVQLGAASVRWVSVWSSTGTIQTSSADMKEGITPLSPERAMQAVRDTQPVTFDYVAPTRTAEWYDLPDDPEQAEQVLQQRLTAAPLEAAARHQAGFVAEQADELFLVGEGQTSPGNSVGVLIAALQHIDQRLTALEGA
jgi:hypothetical protein